MDNLISIFIPTYNRALILNEILEKVIKVVSKYKIDIYVSDNASTDNTKSIVDYWVDKYPSLFYYRNVKNLGADRNMLNILNFTTSKYIMMLGDDDYITENFVDDLYPYLQRDYEFIVLGYDRKYPTIEYSNIDDAFTFLYDKMPYGALIIHTNLVDFSTVEKYIGTYHAYSAIAWEAFYQKKYGRCLYYNDKLLVSLGNVEKTWKSSSLDIYWRAIPLWYSLLPIQQKVKNRVYKKYRNLIFSVRTLVSLKMSLNTIPFSPSEYFSFLDKMKLCVITLIPNSFFRCLKDLKHIAGSNG